MDCGGPGESWASRLAKLVHPASKRRMSAQTMSRSSGHDSAIAIRWPEKVRRLKRFADDFQTEMRGSQRSAG